MANDVAFQINPSGDSVIGCTLATGGLTYVTKVDIFLDSAPDFFYFDSLKDKFDDVNYYNS